MVRFYPLILFLWFLFCADTYRAEAATIDVYVYNNQFSINPPGQPVQPAVITQGDVIRWVWVQGNHTTTSVAGSPEQWSSAITSSNTSFTYQFNTPGTFWYYCIPHGTDNGDGTASGMASTVTVLPAGSGACCLPDGSCITSTQGECLAASGIFAGVGTSCSTTPCLIRKEFVAGKDNVLYESATGTISNALGNHLFAGSGNNGMRRSVLAFDLSSLPANAVINHVELSLFCNNNTGAPYPVSLYKLNQNWGEGTSQATGSEANGATATTGDATWLHTFFNTQFWSVPGGAFTASASATTVVNAQNANFIWTSAQLAADVQHWVSMPGMNYGWILRGDETTTSNTKRFSSRHISTESQRPRLVVHYSIAQTGACCLPDGSCEVTTQGECVAMNGTYKGDGSTCAESFCAVALTPYLDPLPLPAVAVPVTGASGDQAHYRMLMTEQFQQLHSQLPPTRVWGYNGSYPGPTIEAYRDKPVTVEWVNDLRVAETGQLRMQHALPVDECLHGPDKTGQVPVAVVHLHGGKVAPESDGHPDEAFPPGQSSGIYQYPNIQPAGTLWYHDHALGITRLNVMMGLAGLYTLRDDQEKALAIPKGEYEIPLVIQDRSFNPDGSFRYPDTWNEHFFGDVILVNGKVWPYLNVKQGKYRFRVVNGSNSRTYTLALSDHQMFYQIGTDLGLMENPIMLHELTLAPGERAEIVIDFAGYAAGTELILTNSAPAPFPGFPGVGIIPNVMKFVVQAQPGFVAPLPASLVTVEELLESHSVIERMFELKQIPGHDCGDHGHMMWTINGLMWDDITEYPELGSTEIWTWYNQSGIAHPMHMHLVAFQIINRQAIDDVTGLPTGPKIPPDPSERGWKDTANSPPGYVTRVIARFDGFTGLFPYHCHILEHEDHEMMRQFLVVPPGECQDSVMTVVACDSYTFGGVEYTSSGEFEQTITNPEIGCSYTITLKLTINYRAESRDTVTVCDEYTWNGITYSSSGVYEFPTQTKAGCDSVAFLYLTVLKSSTSASTVSVCDSYEWNGQQYTESGTYLFTTTNEAGCDSTATLNLTIRKSSTAIINQVSCDAFTLNGITYTETGQYLQQLTNAAGCDSTIVLNLSIYASGTQQLEKTACDTYTLNDITYTESGFYTQTIISDEGCEIIIQLTLTINRSQSSETSVTACDQFIWNGVTYTNSGTYQFQTLTSAGCDSTAILKLTLLKSSSSETIVQACDQYSWNNQVYTTSGTFTFLTSNKAGCDSTAVLLLTIRKSSSSLQLATACDSYIWNGTTYTASGVYVFTTTNQTGCDSTATLQLTVNYSVIQTETITACDAYTWNGTTYTQSGTYEFQSILPSGCSRVDRLILTINRPSSSILTETACDSFTLNGITYTGSGQYQQLLLNAVGCDSTITLNLTIHVSGKRTITTSSCGPYMWYGQTYEQSGTYTQLVPSPTNCDSLLTLNLTIINLSKSISVAGNVLTAGETGAVYQWINCENNQPIAAATSQQFTVTESGVYAVRITKSGCEVLSDCAPVTIVGLEQEAARGITVYPNPTKGILVLTSDNRIDPESIVVRTVTGQAIPITIIPEANRISLDLSAFAQGVYFLEFNDSAGFARVRMVKE
jgi:FtsP/CotA-like multicopper oxidase with cupredoxin domain